jgi:hypothetical protein
MISGRLSTGGLFVCAEKATTDEQSAKIERPYA